MMFTLSVLILRENYGLLLWQNVLLAKLVNEGKKKKNRKDILLGELVNECKNEKKILTLKELRQQKKKHPFCSFVILFFLQDCVFSDC